MIPPHRADLHKGRERGEALQHLYSSLKCMHTHITALTHHSTHTGCKDASRSLLKEDISDAPHSIRNEGEDIDLSSSQRHNQLFSRDEGRLGTVHRETDGALAAEREVGGRLRDGVERNAKGRATLVQVKQTVGTDHQYPSCM